MDLATYARFHSNWYLGPNCIISQLLVGAEQFSKLSESYIFSGADVVCDIKPRTFW